MKITKYVHSCLLIETPERAGIIDPGEYSWTSGLFNIDALERLDDVIITHEHYDHFHVPFVQALYEKFPDARFTVTQLVAEELVKIGIKNVSTSSSDGIEVSVVMHESMTPLAPPPNPDLVVHYLDRITHPGDSYHCEVSKAVLALPITAPWGTWHRAAELGLELKPKTIIPIHDWHLNNEARAAAYDRFEVFFRERGIAFIKVKDGEPVEL